MRVFLTWRAWVGASLVCLPCFMMTGCKSTGPGGGWLSWMSPKSSSSSLASVPTKPTLPTPSATTGQTFGTGTNLASSPGGAAAGTQPQYYTGPYNTGAPSTLSAGAAGSGYGNSYNQTAAAGAQPAATAPYGGYQSPYQSSGSAGGAYRTADTRSSYGANAATGGYGGAAAQPAAPAPNSWNADQWGRSDARGASQPAGYTEGWSAPANNATSGQSSYLNQNAAPQTNTPLNNGGLAPRTNSGYKPGSTGRSTGALSATPAPAGSVQPNSMYTAPGSAYAGGSAYPSNATYPSTAYPAADPSAPRTSNASTGYAGGFSYPSAPAQPR